MTKNKTEVGIKAIDQDERDLMKAAKKGYGRWMGTLKRTAVEQFHAGEALHKLSQKLKPRQSWVGWQKQNGLNLSSVRSAIELFVRAGSVEAVEGLGIMEARIKFEIVPAKATKDKAGVVSHTEVLPDTEANPDSYEVGPRASEDEEVEQPDDAILTTEPHHSPRPGPKTSPLDALAKLVVALEMFEQKLADEGLAEDDRSGLLRNIEFGLASLDRLRAVVMGRKEVAA